jgi:DNA-directed RNA polymerase subunit E"
MPEKACKKCRLIISQGEVCPICGSHELTTKWSGYVVVLNAEKSEIAKKLNIKVNGRYALSINE